jgi:hypothetical protein
MSPFRYRLHRAKKALFGDNEIIYEVLMHHKANLPNSGVKVEWERDGKFIVGTIRVGTDEYMTQGLNAKEFVEMVNDVLYAVYDVPLEYAEQLGGDYRLTPSLEEFARLDNATVMKSTMNFGHVEVPA